jgi:hypothetical protein
MRTRSLGVLKFKNSITGVATPWLLKKKTFENFCKNLKLKKKEKKLNSSYPQTRFTCQTYKYIHELYKI